MHRSKGGGIVDVSIILQVLMHQAGIDASSRYWCIKQVLMHQAGIDASSRY